MASLLLLFLLVVGVTASGNDQECRAHVLGSEPLQVPLQQKENAHIAKLKLNKRNQDSFLDGITFQIGNKTVEPKMSSNNKACDAIFDETSWWEDVDVVVQGNVLVKVKDKLLDSVQLEDNEDKEVEITIHSSETRLVAFNCDRACPIITSSSMKEIRQQTLPSHLLRARKKTQDTVVVLTKFDDCSCDGNNTLDCGCGSTDLWDDTADVDTWVKMSDTIPHNMVKVIYSRDMEWSLECASSQTGPASKVVGNTGMAKGECVSYIWMTLVAVLATFF